MSPFTQEKLLGHLGVVLYEYLGEEYPEVLGSILGGLKVRERERDEVKQQLIYSFFAKILCHFLIMLSPAVLDIISAVCVFAADFIF